MRFAPASPLRHRDFALYFTGLTVSAVRELDGAYAHDVAAFTRSPARPSCSASRRDARDPDIAFRLLAGAIADRVDRRDFCLHPGRSALTSFALASSSRRVRSRVWHIYLASLINGTPADVDAPARRAMYTTMVPRFGGQDAERDHAQRRGVPHRAAHRSEPGRILIVATGAPCLFINR